MSQEPSQPVAPVEGQAPESASGPDPHAETNAEPKGKTFDEAYVKQLRKEAAAARTELSSVKAKLDDMSSAGKSELERATESSAASERRAVAAEARLLRYEVAASRGFDARLAGALHGESREEIEASADAVAQAIAANQPRMPSLDGGARQTPEQTKNPEEAHNDFLSGVLGLRRPT